MNAQLAKQLLEPIAKKDFLERLYTDKFSKCCGIGHLVRLTSLDPNNFSLTCSDFMSGGRVREFVRGEVSNFLLKAHGEIGDLSTVNNGTSINRYTQDNPKDRIIALLDDMIAEQNK
tara:strand:+ start:2969 stop:3319 length:351 start_codon:yes stop_codon:yes gene_type:complete